METEARLENTTIVSGAAEIPEETVSGFYLGDSSGNDERSNQDDTPPGPLSTPQNWKNLLSFWESCVAFLEGLAINQYDGLRSVKQFAKRDDEIIQSLVESWPGTMVKRWMDDPDSWRAQLCSPFVQQLGKGIGFVGTLAKSWTNESDSWKPWSSFAQYLPESIRQSELLTGLSDGAKGLSDLWYAIDAGVKLSKLPRLDPAVTDPQDDTDPEGSPQ